MKVYKINNILLVIFFAVAISVPLLFVNKTGGKISLSENRALANFPALYTSDNKLNTDFIKEFEDWFKDNLGFRDKFVKANTLLQYKVFGKLTKTDTMIGKNNWLYYVTPDIIKDYQHLNLPSEQQLVLWGNSLERINGYLRGKNIPFIMMLCPDKKTIYPEYYPDTILKVANVSRTDLLTEYITQYTSIDFLSPKDSLMAAKSQATVYSPRYDNAHWNNYGAFIGYLTLMDKVKKYYPEVKVLSWDDFEVTNYEREVKVYNAIPFSETDYSFKLKNESQAVETHGFLEGLNLTESKECFTYVNNNKKLPKALILGDSYFYLSLIPYFAESFSELTFVHSSNADKIGSLVDTFKPNIVIFESAERMLNYIMPVLANSPESLTSYNMYKSLPSINYQSPSDKPLMWLDYYNKNQVQSQGKIILDKSMKVVNLYGWALDQRAGGTAGDIYIKIGDKYYSGAYGTPRTSVSDYFKNPDLLNSGFSFIINAEELISEGKFSFIIISKDKSYQYLPIEYSVEVK